tara:strand:+ start:314 stop:1165 length:852 start_codon:yes stop_codon:yes gene_type:complete
MKTINRQTLIAEELIRTHVRQRIERKIQAESVIRRTVKKILTETEAGTAEPSEYTGINVLADLLEKIVPVVENGYKMLTTSEEQRESFRNHIIHAIKNTLRPIDAATSAEDLPEHFEFQIDSMLLEKIKIDLTPEDDDAADNVEGEFIDIAAPEDDDFVQIDDQNETGRNFAADTFKKVEKQIVDAYDMLADEKDQDLFYDYLITNMLLYLDKFEDELQETLPSVTTPEYEQKKDEEESEDTEPAAEPPADDSATEEPTDAAETGGEEAAETEAPAVDDPFED